MTQAVLINPAVDPHRTRSAQMAKGLMNIPFPQQCTVPVVHEGEEYLFLVDSATAQFWGLRWELEEFLKEAKDSSATIRLPHDDVQVLTVTHNDTKVSWLAARD